MTTDQRSELLKDEYVMLQQFYEDIDGKGLNIKSWSITVAMATMGAGLLYKSSLLFLFASLAALIFWGLEAHWRGLSHFFAVRIQEIETIFKNGEAEKAIPLQAYSKWSEEYDRVKDQTLKYVKKWHVAVPHVFIAIISLILFAAGVFGWL